MKNILKINPTTGYVDAINIVMDSGVLIKANTYGINREAGVNDLITYWFPVPEIAKKQNIRQKSINVVLLNFFEKRFL